MHSLLTTLNAVGRGQLGQILQPKASSFDFTVAVLPRLDDLIGRPDRRADHADRVLNAPPLNRCRHEEAHEGKRFGLFTLLAMEVARSADGEVSAWRMSHHQIPAEVKDVLNVGHPMRTWHFSGQQVAAPCVMAVSAKGITDPAAVLTGD